LKPPPQASEALPVGTIVGDFEIREVIGVGGFGIVYRAWERPLERDVALKEFMPTGLVGRGVSGGVHLRAAAYEDDYILGLRSFRNEARLLARFDHPALVKVFRFWETNATAYMAMPFYKAQTLRQRRQELGAEPVTQAWLMQVVESLLGALTEMHRAEVYHRDIAPDNILWCEDQRPVLLDFGAARRVLTDRTQHLTAVLKPQFAPIEQYADSQSMRQGPWTDLFALASTCYFMLTGRPPLPATARVLSDELVPLTQLAPAGFSATVLSALDWAMAVLPQDRPQSAAILRDALRGHVEVPERFVQAPGTARSAPLPGADFEKTIASPDRAPGRSRKGAASGKDAARAAAARTSHAEAVRDRRFPIVQMRRLRWPLLALAIVAIGSSAWFAPWHPASGELSVTQDAQAAPALVSAAPLVAQPASPGVPALTAMAPGGALQEPVATAVVRDAPTAPASLRPASSTIAGGAVGPREICVANKSANVDECVRRVCKSEPRFRRAAACLRPQRQAEPWWRIFRIG
jgi:serine/threonine protein kinase